jgi:hypothetical protein
MAASPLSHQLLEPDAALEYTAAAREFVSEEPGEGEHPARGIKTFPLPAIRQSVDHGETQMGWSLILDPQSLTGEAQTT